MVGSDDETTPAGWYRQKDDPTTLRWWDGADWTDETMPVPEGLDRAKAAKQAATAPAAAPPAAPVLELSGMPGGGSPTGPSATATASGARPSRTPPRIRIGDDEDDWVAKAWAADDVGPPDRPRPPSAPRPARPRPPQARPGPSPRPRQPDERAHVVQRQASNGARVIGRALIVLVLLGGGWLAYTQLRDAAPNHAATLSASVPVADKPDPGLRPLSAVVIQLRDLPKGWLAQASDASATTICLGRSPASVISPSDAKVATFNQGPGGPYLTNVVEQFATVSLAKQFMDLTAKTANTCRSYQANGSTIRLGPLDFPEFGDQTFAARATGTSPLGAIDSDLIYVRKGARVVSLQTISIGQAKISDELVLFLSRGVAARL